MRRTRQLLQAVCLLGFAAQASAAIRMGAPFGDHMVLPRDVPVTLWGTGAPGGDTVRVHFAGQTVTGRSDWEGRWQVQLSPMRAGGPYQMNVEIGGGGPYVPSSAANNTGGLELNDVMVGDVITVDTTAPAKAEATTGAAAAGAARPIAPERYALVRVYLVAAGAAAGHWVSMWQGRLPAGSEALFRSGQMRFEAAQVPVGVMAASAAPRCPPSTACSAH